MSNSTVLRFLISSTSIICLTSFASEQPLTANNSIVFTETVATQSRSRQFTITSQELDHEIVVVVAEPPPGIGVSSERSSDVKLPAVYALDNGYGIVGPIAQMLSLVFAISPTYVVSIGSGKYRNTDLLHQEVIENGESFGGGGEAFESFLIDSLKPFLESRYPIDPNKSVLFGHSFGGTFAANLLASNPEAFSSYVIASPSVSRDPQVVDRINSNIGRIGNKRIFLSVGGREPAEALEGASKIREVLTSEASKVVLESRIFDGEGHISHYPLLVTDALNWLFPTNSKQASDGIVLSREALEWMAGEYELSDGRIVTLGSENDQIYIKMTGMPGQSPLLAEAHDRFFIPGFDVEISLILPIKGPATGLIVRANGIEIRGERVD